MSLTELSKLKRQALRGLLRNPNYSSRRVSTLAEKIGESEEVTTDLLDQIGASVNGRGYASLND